MQLKEMHDEACRCSTAIMLKDGHLAASFFLVRMPSGRLNKLMTPWQTRFQKWMYVTVMRGILEDANINAYTFVTEAWIAKVDLRTEPELMNIPPSERSQRKDILFINSRHRNGECYTTQYDVEYDAVGKVTLSPPEQLPGDLGGFMGNLFHDDEEPVMASGTQH